MYTLLTLLFLRKRILGIRYKHQVIRIMRLQAVWILLSYQFTRVNELWNTACRTPLPKINWLRHGVDIVMSDLQYIIVLREAYKVQTRKYYIQHGVNRYMPSVRYLFLRKLTYTIQMQKCIFWNGDTIQKIHNKPVTWELHFLLDAGTISPKILKWTMLFFKIYI